MPGIPFAFWPFQATRATCAIGPAPWALCAGKGAAAALHREHGRHSTNREVLQTKQDKQLRLPVCSLHIYRHGYVQYFYIYIYIYVRVCVDRH